VYLASAREHPPAALLRQQQHDVSRLIHVVRDFNERQTQLFFMLAGFLARYQPPELQRLMDQDVSEAAVAMASTFETAARGVIYDHRPSSAAAERLVTAFKPHLVQAGQSGGSAFERDAAVVLRRLAEGAHESGLDRPADTRGYLEWLGRIISTMPDKSGSRADGSGAESLILP
jgi:hypothetical protein